MKTIPKTQERTTQSSAYRVWSTREISLSAPFLTDFCCLCGFDVKAGQSG